MKEPRSIHITLTDVLKHKLRLYSNARTGNLSATIRYSLEKLFDREELIPDKEAALAAVIATRFNMPKGYDLRSFWNTLFVLAQKFPSHSSLDVWSEAVYLRSEELSNLEVYSIIKKETHNLLSEQKAAKKETKDAANKS